MLAVEMAVERRWSGDAATMQMLKAISKEIVKIEAEAEHGLQLAEMVVERRYSGHKATMHMLKAILKEIVKIKLRSESESEPPYSELLRRMYRNDPAALQRYRDRLSLQRQ